MTFVHDPDAVLPYVWDWSAWLANENDDTIVTATVDVDGVTLDSSTNSATTVTAWISGGIDGEDAELRCHITTTGGRQDDRTITLLVRER